MERHTHQGFSLIELLIAIAVVGILAAIALPSYQDHIRRGNRGDGQSALLEASSRMERYYYDNNAYTTDLTDIGYPSSNNVQTSEGHYLMSVSAPTAGCPIATCYAIEVVAQNNQTADGNLSVNSMGEKLPVEKW